LSKAYPVTGGKEIAATLNALGKRIESQLVRSGLTAAANPPLEEARLGAMGWSSAVSAAIKKGSPRRNQDGTYSIRIYVDPTKPGAYTAWWGEYGVRPHLIASTGAGEGRVAVRKAAAGNGTVKNGVMKIGDRYLSGIIHHPGHVAHPFMRKALDVRAEEAIQAFAAKIRDGVEKRTGFNLAADMDEAA
jgi:hypothetical protein